MQHVSLLNFSIQSQNKSENKSELQITSKKMSYTGVFFLICAIITICKAQSDSDCDETMCNNACKYFHLNGTCHGINECDCYYGKKCSEMVDVICNIACKAFKFEGDCDDNDQCICKAELEVCPIPECQE